MIFVTGSIYGQDMTMPPPVQVKLFDMIEGEWESEPYEMMGSKFIEHVNHKWVFNHQYFMIDLKAKSDNMNYEGIGYMTANKDGALKGWWFDGYGPEMMAMYTGTSAGNTATVSTSNSMFKETREIEVNGDVMIHKVNQTMTDKEGKETKMNMTIKYNRAK